MDSSNLPKLGNKKYRIPRGKSQHIIMPSAYSSPEPFSTPPLKLLKGFAAFIIIVAILLMLPLSSKSGAWTSPLDSARKRSVER